MYLSPRSALSRLRAGLRRRRARVGVGCMSTTFPSIERRSRHPAALEEDGSSVAEDETVRGDRRSASRRAVLCAKSLRRSAEITWNTHGSPFPAHIRIVDRCCRPPHPCATRDVRPGPRDHTTPAAACGGEDGRGARTQVVALAGRPKPTISLVAIGQTSRLRRRDGQDGRRCAWPALRSTRHHRTAIWTDVVWSAAGMTLGWTGRS
jgi:hypothetical protein